MDAQRIDSQSSFNTPSQLISQVTSKIQRKFAGKFKSKKKMVQPLNKWKRRCQSYSIWEAALFTFCLGALYLVNPEFIAFRYLRSIKNGVLCACNSLFVETKLAKVIKGDIKLSSVFNPSSWNPQEVLSLIVTIILVLFFLNNIVMDQWNDWSRRKAKQKLVDVRMSRSKVSRISPDLFESQKKAYTRKHIGQLLNSEAYKEKFSVVKRLYDERTEQGSQPNNEPDLSETELFKADYFDGKFDRIDKELKKEKKQGKYSQVSAREGPPQPVSQMLR